MSEKMLITADQVNPLEIFVEGKYDGLLDFIKKESTIENPTVKNKAGRDLIRSTAASIASSKVFIEKARKKLADAEKSKIEKKLNSINSSGKFIEEYLVSLKTKVRKPLTDYEAEIKAKEAAELAEQERIKQEKIDAEKAEFERQKQELAEEKQKLKDERLKVEAEENARKKIESEQKESREAETRKRIEAEAETERLKKKAIDDENQARLEKQIAVDNERKLAKAEAERIENERLENERIAREIAESKATDLAHQKRINNEALPGLINLIKESESEPDIKIRARKILIGLIMKKVEHVSVNY